MFARTAGLSLIEVLVVVSIMGLGAVAMTQVMRNMANVKGLIEDEADLMNMKHVLRGRLSCKETLQSATSCAANIELKDKNNKILIPTGGKAQGPWTLRARCVEVATKKQLVVQAAKLKSGKPVNSTDANDFVKNPLSGEPMSWSNSNLWLFSAEDDVCGAGSHLGTGGPGGTGSSSSSGPSLPISREGTLHVDLAGCDKKGASKTAWCPADRPYVISGGVRCIAKKNDDNEMIASHAVPGTKDKNGKTGPEGWRGGCCDSSDVQVWAICIP